MAAHHSDEEGIDDKGDHAMKARRTAFTLIELIVVMTVMSAIFGTMLLTLHVLGRTSRGFTDRIADSAQQRRFALQLRTDAHEAQDALIDESDSGQRATTVLKLTVADDQFIEYRLHENRIERQVRVGEAVAQREDYRVSPALDRGWTLDRNRAKPLLRVFLYQHAGLGADQFSNLPPVQIIAAIGVNSLRNSTVSP